VETKWKQNARRFKPIHIVDNDVAGGEWDNPVEIIGDDATSRMNRLNISTPGAPSWSRITLRLKPLLTTGREIQKGDIRISTNLSLV